MAFWPWPKEIEARTPGERALILTPGGISWGMQTKR